MKESIQFKDIVWTKLCKNTATPKGYECSNSIPGTTVGEIYNVMNKRWESTI